MVRKNINKTCLIYKALLLIFKILLFISSSLCISSIKHFIQRENEDSRAKSTFTNNLNYKINHSYKIFLTENSLNENEKLFRLFDDTRYDSPITSNWSRDLAIAYRDIAGIAYNSKNSAEMQINEILKGNQKDENKIGFFFRKFFEIGDWEHILTRTAEKELNNYSYTIMRNKRIGKVILAFSGTKGIKQLFTEYLNSDMETFFRYQDERESELFNLSLTKEEILNNLKNLEEKNDNKDNLKKKDKYDYLQKNNKNDTNTDDVMNNNLFNKSFGNKENLFKNIIKNFKIMKYFNFLYKSIASQLQIDLQSAKSSEISQYVFVGHSLGGAIASLAAYDLISQGLLPVTKGDISSPVLITYGQPRTGNYVYANEISKKIPIIFRHVNNYDIITSMPECYKINNFCVNEYGKDKIDLDFSDYSDIKIDPKLLKENNFPWHSNGLILNIDDENSNECIKNSETEENIDQEKEKCKVESKMRIAFHTIYFGYKVADMFKTEIFKYHLTEISCSIEDLFDFDVKIPIFSSINSLRKYLFEKVPILNDENPNDNRNASFLEIEEKKNDIISNENKLLFSNKYGICYYLLKIFRFFGRYQ